MARAWVLGNTTVRSALRLKDGLHALVASGLGQNLLGNEYETAFARALDGAGVVELNADTNDVSSLGRKWRGALGKLGFIVPMLPARLQPIEAQLGKRFTVTQNGLRLLEATTVPAIQEVFLRAIAAVQLPSPMEPRFQVDRFSPLRHTLRVLLELPERDLSAHIDTVEMSSLVQLAPSDVSTSQLVSTIADIRARRAGATNKREFDRLERERAAALAGVREATLLDYADTNFRYLKATGLVQSRGRGIALVPEQTTMARLLAAEDEPTLNDFDYLKRLCAGAVLPTDEQSGALEVVSQLAAVAKTRGIPIDLKTRNLNDPGSISLVRYELEDAIAKSKELDYAAAQAGQVEEIVAYMQLIATRARSVQLSDGTSVRVPNGEMPAYFEWILWRAFLAINHLAVKPYQVRRFNIDQDFLPVGTAPGRGADLVVELDDFVIVVEVTLTESSRQEAAEGEPVRRHVADASEEYASVAKPVYGLFIANRIDSNTAETFRIGVWYRANDERTTLDIAPLTLAQFRRLFIDIFDSGERHPRRVRALLDRAIQLRDSAPGAPEWKAMLQHLLPA